MSEIDRSVERTLRGMIAYVWQAKIVFVTTFLIVFFLIFAVVFFMITPLYEASSLIFVGQSSVDRDARAVPASTTSVSLAQVASSDDVVKAAIEKVGLSKLTNNQGVGASPLSSRIRALFTVDRDETPIDAISYYLPRISRSVVVRAEPSSDLIRISFRNRNPQNATDFVNALAQAFIERQITIFSKPGAAQFFSHQKERFDQELQKAYEKLERFERTTGTYSADEQRELLLKRRNDLSLASALTRSTISQKIGEKGALADELKKLAPVARSPYVSALVDSLSAAPVGQGTRNSAPSTLQGSSDPPLLLVKVYQDSMTTLFKIDSDLAGLQNMQKQQTAELAETTDDLNKIARSEQEYSRLRRSVKQAALNSDLYAKKMIEEQIIAESDTARFSAAKVLQAASIPLRPASPNYPIAVVADFIASLLFGFGAVTIVHNLRLPRIVPTRALSTG